MARGYLRHSAILGDPWHCCDRCECPCRISTLTWQNGLLLCTKCWDNPDAWSRDTLIQDALSNSAEEAQVAEKLKGSTNEPEPPIP